MSDKKTSNNSTSDSKVAILPKVKSFNLRNQKKLRSARPNRSLISMRSMKPLVGLKTKNTTK